VTRALLLCRGLFVKTVSLQWKSYEAGSLGLTQGAQQAYKLYGVGKI
jgi:hypothetical protein